MNGDQRFGGNGRRHYQRKGKHSITVLGHALPGDPESAYLCRGKATVWIFEHKIGSEELGKTVGETEFRVAEAP